MDLDTYLIENCPVELVQTVRATDLRNPGDDDIYYVLNENAAPTSCEVAATVFLAPKIMADSDYAVVQGFLSAVATYHQLFPETALPVLDAALARIPADDNYGISLLTALRKLGVDQRERLAISVPEIWNFSTPADDTALPWHYALYEYSLGDTDALGKLSRHIDDTADATDAYALLLSLNELPGQDVTAVISRFSTDTRRTRGASGPDLPLGELVEDLLDLRG